MDTGGRKWKVGLAIVLLALAVWRIADHAVAPVPPVRLPIRIGIPKQLPSSLMIIAQQQGFFAEQGLEVELHTYPSGARALTDGLLRDEVDVVSSADVPFVFQSFSQPDLTALAVISLNTNSFRVLARRDRGVFQVSDLKGKIIAAQPNSAGHYFIHALEEVEHLAHGELHTVLVPLEKLGAGLVAGHYDAVATREPYLQQIAAQLGDKAVMFAEPGAYLQHELLLTRKSYLQHHHPDMADRLLRALRQAEQFYADNPIESRALLGQFIGIQHGAVDADIEYELSLPQALLFTLDAQARWAVADGLVQHTPPDFLQHIETAPFKRVLPLRATLIE